MPATLIKNIRKLVNVRTENKLLRGKELSQLNCLENAYLMIEDGIIAEYGFMNSALPETKNVIDASGQFIMPSWCDSHTHLIFVFQPGRRIC